MVDAGLISFITLFFVFGLPIIFLIIFFLKFQKPIEQAKIQTPREVIVKEVVMVPCEYCHGLMSLTVTECPHCRSPRKM